MARVLSTAVVLALLTATALAFVITERAKLEKSPIMGTNVTPLFSPSAVDPKLKNAEVIFRLRTTERIEVWIQDHEGNRVRDLQAPRTFRHGSRLDLVWDGFTDSGVLVPDGVYVPVVKLLRSHRTIVLPSEIKLDTKPPVITVHHPQYPIISPDGDGRHDTFTTTYRINERAHAILSVRGTQVEYTRSQKQVGELHWNGQARRSAAARSPGALPPDRCRARRGGQPVEAVSRSRSCRCATSRSRATASSCVPAGSSRCVCRRTPRPSVGRCTDAPARSAPARCASRAPQVGRRLPPVRDRRDARRALHGGGRVSTGAAQAAGALGALGLAFLIVAPRQDARIAGFVAWALGCAGLAIYLAPHGHHRVLAAAVVFGVIAAGVGAWIFLRLPWLLAVATLACVPARIPVHVGSTQANLLLPLYGVVAAAAIALAWELFGDRPRTRELGKLSWPLALFVAWQGVSIFWSKDVRQGAIELLFFVLPFGLLAVSLARLAWSRGWVLALYVAARGDGARVRGDRDRAVRDAQHLLEPEGDRRQRVRAERVVLPRELGLLRPVDLRALPRRSRSSRAS